MNITLKNKKYLIVLPALAALFIALIPTLKYQWPLSWDIIYHIQYAQVYAHYGFTLTDPLLEAPLGKKIGYPPLFHFLIVVLGNGLGLDFFQVARILQPILATSVVLSVSYVAQKFYGEVAGAGAGFLMLSSYLVSRMVLPLPENLALIFIPLAVYLYYHSFKNKNIKTAFFGGILFILVILTHQAATLCLSLIITSITIMELAIYRKICVLKNFFSFLLPLIFIGITGVVIIQIWAPQLMQNMMQQGITAVTGLSTSIGNRPLGIFSYLGNIGFLVLVFSLIGGVTALKKYRWKDLVTLVWIISMILLSYAYLFGISVISYRVLIYLLIPLCILGGYGISYSFHKLSDYEIFSSIKVRTAFLVVIFALSIFSGVLTVENSKIAVFGVETDYGVIQIAPPSESEIDLANWFEKNGNKSRSVVISNHFTGIFLATKAMQPLHYGFEFFSTNNNVPIEIESAKSSDLDGFVAEKIGYVIYDKRLTVKPPENKLALRMIDAEFSPLYYFTQDISSNINIIKPDFSRVVYENQDYIVCEVIYEPTTGV